MSTRPGHGASEAPGPGHLALLPIVASYWSVQAGGKVHDNLVWSYEDPIPAAAQIAGLMCFYNERVELTVGHARQPGPQTSSSP